MRKILVLSSFILMAVYAIGQEKLSSGQEKLAECPDKPNCVSSEVKNVDSWVEPLVYQEEPSAHKKKPSAIFKQLKAVLLNMNGTIVQEQNNYLAATFTSRIFRFVDDVEFRLDEQKNVIHIRSASRTGYSDFGVNRKRVEKIRADFTQYNKHYVELATKAQKIVSDFAGTLQPQLLAAIQAGGFVNAVDVCAVKAQQIAMQLSDETQWQVGRVSLKARNNEKNTPDVWETAVLQQFDSRQRNGEPVEQISHAEIIDGQFRYMKAQGVKPVCLGCHGEQLAPDVKKVLQHYYPEDKATGYTLGQVRGAFSLSKDL